MENALLKDLKRHLDTLSSKELKELCVRLARYKKENKELLFYLLEYRGNENDYIAAIKEEIDIGFAGINKNNIYYSKKGVRKVLRMTNKYIKYSGFKQTEVDLLIYFCSKFKESGFGLNTNISILNIYQRQILKIRKAIKALDEDLQFDYGIELEALLSTPVKEPYILR